LEENFFANYKNKKAANLSRLFYLFSCSRKNASVLSFIFFSERYADRKYSAAVFRPLEVKSFEFALDHTGEIIRVHFQASFSIKEIEPRQDAN